MRGRVDRVLDPLLAVLAFGLSVPPLLRPTGGCGCPAVPAWAFVLLAAQCLPLAVRRRWPFASSLAIGVATIAYGVTWLPDPAMPYAGLVGLYTVAAHGSRRTGLAAAGTAAVAIALAMAVDPAADYQDVLVTYLLFATAWLLGNGARQRREGIEAAEARATALERTRAAEADRAVVEERNRIARELHDVVAHHVSMMVVQAEAGPVAVGRDDARAVQAFDTISATGRQALTEMRRLLGVLRADAASLAPQPGAERIPELVDGVRAAGLDVSLEVTGTPGPLPPAVDLSAYRLLQEALTNALRHAGPARVTARVAYGPDAVEISVVDDGLGTAEAGPAAGHGLVAMRERVGLVGGSVAAGPEPGGGWAVRARLPVAP
jgi:signal transduction histidine kinase